MGDVRGFSNASQVPTWVWTGETPQRSEGAATSGPKSTDQAAATTQAMQPKPQRFEGVGRNPAGDSAALAQQAAFEGDASLVDLVSGASTARSGAARGRLLDKLAEHAAQVPSFEIEVSATGQHSRPAFTRLARGLAEDTSLSMTDLLTMADDADALVTSLNALPSERNTLPSERRDMQNSLRRAPISRLALEVRDDALDTISDARQHIQTLAKDPQALRVHLGHIAASSPSTQELARALEGLGVGASVRMDTAITLQALHRDPQRLALFMAGEDVGLEPVVGRLQSALPTALRALDRMEADLKRPDLELEALVSRPEFAACRERVLRASVPPRRRPELRAQIGELRREARRSELMGGAGMELQMQQAGDGPGRTAWDIGSIVLNTVRDAQRVRHASDYVNHGLAERSLPDQAAATFALNRIHEGLSLAHPAAGAAMDAVRIAETFVP